MTMLIELAFERRGKIVREAKYERKSNKRKQQFQLTQTAPQLAFRFCVTYFSFASFYEWVCLR
jgi:hypothetical protein